MDLNKIDVSQLRDYLEKGMEQVKKFAENPDSIQYKPEVKVIADSITDSGKRLITLECTFWRVILPELSRHRVFSLSVRSSRAVPTDKLLKEIEEKPWGPEHWGQNRPGMSASEDLDSRLVGLCRYIWSASALNSVRMAQCLIQNPQFQVHKQVVNRLLEPYVCTHVLVSSTEWDNFFKLRISDAAQPEMKTLAEAMKAAMDSSTPTLVHSGQWHLPYITEPEKELALEAQQLVSAARCARISYKAFDGTTSVDKDLELAHKLISMGHWSPFEHQATPHPYNSPIVCNFKGWDQQRKFLEKE